MPDLEDEVGQDYGKTSVQVVTPGSPDDPFSANPDRNAAPPVAAQVAEGAQAAAQGAPAGAEGTQDTEDDVLPVAAAAPGEGDLTPAQEARMRAMLDEELKVERERIRAEVRNEEIPRIQSGLDRRLGQMQERVDALQAERDASNKLIRDQQIANLAPEEQARIREGWANEDAAKANADYADELAAYHDDLEVYRLFAAYQPYGVTEEDLRGIEFDDREAFCLRKENEALRSGAAPAATNTNGTQAQPAPATVTEPARPAPAGSRAASDRGGGSVPLAAPERDTGQNMEALEKNVGQGWEAAPAGFSRGRR